jgi:predicted HAD superfamily phosphohydrolase
MIKKDIDYLVGEVVADCYMTIYFHPARQSEVVGVMQQAVELRNSLFDRANHPAEKNNPSLVRKHYAALRRDLLEKIDELFVRLSEVCKKNELVVSY